MRDKASLARHWQQTQKLQPYARGMSGLTASLMYCLEAANSSPVLDSAHVAPASLVTISVGGPLGLTSSTRTRLGRTTMIGFHPWGSRLPPGLVKPSPLARSMLSCQSCPDASRVFICCSLITARPTDPQHHLVSHVFCGGFSCLPMHAKQT